MAECMKKVAELDDAELNVEERNLLSVAYKNVIGARRAAWRIVSSLEPKAEKNKDLIIKYRKKIESELDEICGEILQLLNKHLIKNSTSAESKVFFHKM